MCCWHILHRLGSHSLLYLPKLWGWYLWHRHRRLILHSLQHWLLLHRSSCHHLPKLRCWDIWHRLGLVLCKQLHTLCKGHLFHSLCGHSCIHMFELCCWHLWHRLGLCCSWRLVSSRCVRLLFLREHNPSAVVVHHWHHQPPQLCKQREHAGSHCPIWWRHQHHPHLLSIQHRKRL